ncbi:MAG: NAD-dependent epimerase/dehydratase family protein [Patescibacteria group bacterium]
MKKLILVTGGAGFVGSHLCKRLAAEGHTVISLDNYFTGSRENHVPGVEYREGHTKDIERLVPETPDLIFHLGEYSRVAKSLDEPDIVLDLNVTGTAAVLEFWRTKGCKLVYAGSSTKFVAAREDGTTGRDLSPYTWGKAINSELVANYGRWYDLRYSIAYFYNVYGPGERSIEEYGTVVETFRQNLMAGRPHQVRSPGTQTRAFTHVDDTVSGLIAIAEKGANDEYSISSDDVCSLLDLAALFGGAVEILPQTKSSRSSGAEDTSKLKALGWKQEKSLKDYIGEVTSAV